MHFACTDHKFRLRNVHSVLPKFWSNLVHLNQAKKRAMTSCTEDNFGNASFMLVGLLPPTKYNPAVQGSGEKRADVHCFCAFKTVFPPLQKESCTLLSFLRANPKHSRHQTTLFFQATTTFHAVRNLMQQLIPAQRKQMYCQEQAQQETRTLCRTVHRNAHTVTD